MADSSSHLKYSATTRDDATATKSRGPSVQPV